MSLRLYFATGNRGKFKEAQRILGECDVELVMAPWIPKIEVQADDVLEVARIAALHAHLATRLPVVVEDTGLYIEALNGFPGVYAAHVYKTIGLQGVLRLLEGVENRRAFFRTAVVAVIPPRIYEAVGVVEGRIVEEPRGSGGFGYDPIFEPLGAGKTYAEMSVEEKNRWSHRGRAFKTLCEALREAGLVRQT